MSRKTASLKNLPLLGSIDIKMDVPQRFQMTCKSDCSRSIEALLAPLRLEKPQGQYERTIYVTRLCRSTQPNVLEAVVFSFRVLILRAEIAS